MAQDKFHLNSVSILLFVLAVGLSNKISKGAKLEFDEQASSAIASASMSVYAGAESDTDTWQDPGIVYDHSMAVYTAAGGAWASGSASIHSDVNDAYSDEDGYIDDAKLFKFVYNQHFLAIPSEDANHHITPASFSVQLDASGNLYWNLLPTNPNEKEGDLVVIGFCDWSSLGSNSTNMIYQQGTMKEYWVESQKLGPYHVVCFCPSCGCNSDTPSRPIGLIARLGDKIKISYNANVDGHSSDDTQYSDYYDSVYGQSIQLSIRTEVEPLNMTFMDKRWLREKNLLNILQNREEVSPEVEEEAETHAVVDGACADGATQLILVFDLCDWSLLFEPCDIPADTENPTAVRLSVSLDGKDNGYLIDDGQDNDNDGYDDTPRIKSSEAYQDGIFTQTWCAPSVFDSNLANKEKMRKIPVQIEIDKDGDEIYDYNFIEYIELVRPPVVMVHGWRGLPDMWSDINNALEANGVECWVYNYPDSHPPYAIGNPIEYAKDLKKWIENEQDKKHYKGKFNIVCHSMGAMVSRYYMEELGGDTNVSQWIGLAPVNNGAAIAKFGSGIRFFLGWLFPDLWLFPDDLKPSGAINHMNIKSCTLAKLNYGISQFDQQIWGNQQVLSGNVIYRNLMGIIANCNGLNADRSLSPGTAGKTYVCKKDNKGKLYWYWTWQGDGVVAMVQSILIGANVGNEVFVGKNHSGTPNRPQTAIYRDPEVIKKIVNYILNPNSALVNNCCIFDPNDDHYTTGKGNKGNINQSQSTEITIPIDPTVAKAIVALGWGGSELDLILISPEGEVLEPNAATEYYKSDTSIWYTIDSPEIGEWTAVVEAVNVPAEGEPFDLITFHSSPLILTGTTSKDRTLYYTGEIAALLARLENNDVPLSGASVMAEITRPDSSIESLVLYDDGTHGDANAGDGCYSAQYLLANKGVYQIILSAQGTVEGMPFERIDPVTLWVTSLGDIDGDGDVDFSDFARLATRWGDANCNSIDRCEMTDLDGNGNVTTNDLAIFTEHWLEGTWHPIPGDIAGDGKVDMDDLKILAEQWLQPPGVPSADIAPLPPDDIVNFLDFAVIADHWLEGTSP